MWFHQMDQNHTVESLESTGCSNCFLQFGGIKHMILAPFHCCWSCKTSAHTPVVEDLKAEALALCDVEVGPQEGHHKLLKQPPDPPPQRPLPRDCQIPGSLPCLACKQPSCPCSFTGKCWQKNQIAAARLSAFRQTRAALTTSAKHDLRRTVQSAAEKAEQAEHLRGWAGRGRAAPTP